MSKHHLTFSKTDLAQLCQWWAQPSVVLPERESSPAAQSGTDGHSAIEMVLLRYGVADWDGSKFATLYGCSEEDEMIVANNISMSIDRIANVFDCKAEVAFAYDPQADTARVLPMRNGHRDYSSVKPHEIAGTFDLVGLDLENRIGLVYDWKFGMQAGLPHPSESGQLLAGALCLARVYDLDEVVVGYGFPQSDGDINTVQSTVDAFDLAAFADTMRDVAERIHAIPKPQPGMWCTAKWCPAVGICPVSQAAANDVSEALPEDSRLPVVFEVSQITCPDHAIKLHTNIKLAERYSAEMLSRARAALKAYLVKTGPVEIGDGGILGVVQKEGRESVDVTGNADALAAIREALGDAADAALAVEIKSSKTAIEDASKKVAKGKERTALVMGLYEKLRATGGLRKGAPYDVVDVVYSTRRR